MVFLTPVTLTFSMIATTRHRRQRPTADFGDVRAEFYALLSGCGLYDLGWRAKIVLAGSDRVRWLNGMISNNVRDLATGHGVYAFLLNAQGHIQADLYVFQRGNSLLVDTERSQRDKVLQFFDHYIIADDVEVKDISDQLTALGLTGPGSRKVLERAGIVAPELGYLQFADVNWNNATAHRAAFGRRSRGLVASLDCAAAPHSLWDALVKAGARPAGNAALNLFRISRGDSAAWPGHPGTRPPAGNRADARPEFHQGLLPWAGNRGADSFSRGGASAVPAFAVEGPLPEPGTKIHAEGKEVGGGHQQRNSASACGDRPVALGYLRQEGGRETTCMREMRKCQSQTPV